jgi:1-acyl-sn-glycerol-3-phosphate acyltransferase
MAAMARQLDLLAVGEGRLGRVERFQIRFIRSSFRPGPGDTAIRWAQRRIGATWIHHFTKNLRHVHGLERLPELDPGRSYICISNHRSFFDLYVITAHLVRLGMRHRLVFPVRANFFYDQPLGLVVNGVMSFFAMYPPIFRERRRLVLNAASLDELARLLNAGGMFAGLHPEGTRNKGDDPYALLPAQPGVGRVIHGSCATVLPVFINGLGNDLPRQIGSNFDGSGTPIHVVFGEPLGCSELRRQPGSPRIYRAIAERAMEAIRELGAEERAIRARGGA